MKYILVLADGMSDYPMQSLGGKTVLEVAHTPNMDALARAGSCGVVTTVPMSLPPGSDVANLSVMGYDPELCYSGRSPLEAMSLGIDLGPSDVAVRANLVTLSNAHAYKDRVMLDYSAGEIETDDARALVEALAHELDSEDMRLYPGLSYRHCLVWKNGKVGLKLTPPHDISDKIVGPYLPQGDSSILVAMMEKSCAILEAHPVNRRRISSGKNPANSLWFWGEGRKPQIESFQAKHGLHGAVISAVDLLKGIAISAGMSSIEVAGATGTIATNFVGKADAALRVLQEGHDFVYVHIEAPDECGHHGDFECKKKAIELVDSQVLGRILEGISSVGEARVMVLPDHPTPIELRTHTRDAVPFVACQFDKNGIAQQHQSGKHAPGFSEKTAASTGLVFSKGCMLLPWLFTAAIV